MFFYFLFLFFYGIFFLIQINDDDDDDDYDDIITQQYESCSVISVNCIQYKIFVYFNYAAAVNVCDVT